jgi:hypothetical protein
MKITKSRLRQIIKEEIFRIIEQEEQSPEQQLADIEDDIQGMDPEATTVADQEELEAALSSIRDLLDTM